MGKYILVSLLIFLGAIANIFLKIGINRSLLPEINSLGNVFQVVFILLKNYWMWLAFLAYGPGLLIFLYLLRKSEISYLVPIMASLTLILILFFSWVVFKEDITPFRVIGILLITLGVFFVAKSVINYEQRCNNLSSCS